MASIELKVDFSALRAAVHRMNADSIVVGPVIDRGEDEWSAPEWERIDDQLLDGVEVDLDEVTHSNGLLELKGRQVMLYIPDHGGRVGTALQNGEMGKRIHVAWCRTLKEMEERGRYERYVVTTRTGPEFPISGRDETGGVVEGDARLMVCKNCLKFLRYRGYTGGSGPIWRGFILADFYDEYSTFFPRMPTRWAGTRDGYADNWEQVSREHREGSSWTCEECHVQLDDARDLLHVHHRNGVKSDNSKSNLKSVCLLCHKREPQHGHMRIKLGDYKRIQRRRRRQRLLDGLSWRDVDRLVDPGAVGAVDRLASARAEIPELGWEVMNNAGRRVAEPELAWPKQKVGVAIGNRDLQGMRAAGWKGLRVHQVTPRDESVPPELLGSDLGAAPF